MLVDDNLSVRAGKFTVINKQGLHVRPATVIAEVAIKYPTADLMIGKNGHFVDAKAPLNILTIADVDGTEYELRAGGPDAHKVIEEVIGLSLVKFNVSDD